MPQQIFKIVYRKDDSLIISAEELTATYFFGIGIKDQLGNVMPNNTINNYIKSAQLELEHFLDIKLNKQIVREKFDFFRDDWYHWGFIPTTYPVNKAFSLDGFVNTIRQIQYPDQWLSVRTSNNGLYRRQIHIIPNQDSPTTNSNSVVYSGITPHMGFLHNRTIPNYWEAVYCTGFDEVPMDLVNFVGKLAAINIFHILGDLILGAGIASQSIGIDGLSQSISTTSSATNAGYGSRITGYLADLKKMKPELKSYYKGFTMTAL